MRTDTAPKPTLLSEYEPPNFKIDSVFLDFDLSPNATKVLSKLELRRLAAGPLELNGEDISLKSVKLDGKRLKRSDYSLSWDFMCQADGFARNARLKAFGVSLIIRTARMYFRSSKFV